MSSYLKYSCKKETVYSGIYRYKVSNGDKTITTPYIHSGNAGDTEIKKIVSVINNLEYYMDNGKNAFENVVGSVLMNKIAEKFGLTDEVTAMVSLANSIKSKEKTTAEKVIDFLKTTLGFIKIPDAFLIGDVVVAIVDYHETKIAFETLDDLI
ncbi:hypothetical protein [Tepidibacter formicigenes]|jgi:predicted Zn-dependent protease with MMP-like domain|uniref:Uncharacterized protein n=1 Tax=Tepidibacter formicigenes DSM 15518 TaxID=1123349 RepID=A0A1M6UCK2_9FIRM|nr:hypothetical protein [Tepidibacter formicigenes]SHK66778.1 hypothetical protein SAMN02744037_02773 [Tepidibacter formicigenes DSM 15518]